MQAQDGSFVGTADDSSGAQYMIAFDETGSLRWSVPDYWPEIATADGSVIATPGTWYSAGDGSATTFDSNGNATGQMANMPTYSWKGNTYEIGSVDRLLPMPLDFALSFGAFSSGNPSANGTAVRLVQSKMFLPVELSETDAVVNTTFYDQAKKNLDPTKIALSLLVKGDATVNGFRKALAATNMIVGYLGHGALIPGAPRSAGLCFLKWCIVFRPLTFVTLSDGSPAELAPAQGMQWDYIENGLAPKAKVVFLAACGIDSTFIAQWHLRPQQALIVPVYLTSNEFSNINLYHAAWEWQSMLLTLAEGKTVNEAVTVGNSSAANLEADHRWKVIGDGNVTIGTPLQ